MTVRRDSRIYGHTSHTRAQHGKLSMFMYCRYSTASNLADPCESLLPLGFLRLLCFAREDLNLLVRQHIQSVVSRGFSRALATIEAHIMDLVASGMLTLSAKLSSLEDEKLLTRMIEIWIHFFDQILPYVEGVRGILSLNPNIMTSSCAGFSSRPYR
jgi:hypothetical protein